MVRIRERLGPKRMVSQKPASKSGSSGRKEPTINKCQVALTKPFYVIDFPTSLSSRKVFVLLTIIFPAPGTQEIFKKYFVE